MKFFKNFNLPVVAVVFFVCIAAVIVFTVTRPKNNDETIVAAKRLENKPMPAGILGQINQERFFLVYLTSGCKACFDELRLLSEAKANSPELKIYGIMGEDEAVVKNYVRDNKIEFPVISDRNLDMLRVLKVEFFPTNLTIENGVIKRAYVGAPESKEKLLALIAD